MNEDKVKCLNNVISEGVLTSEDFDNFVFDSLGMNGEQMRHYFVAQGYLEEIVGTDEEGLPTNFYRITEKGLVATQSLPKRLWYSIKGDTRSIIVSVITAFLVTFLTLFLTGIFSN